MKNTRRNRVSATRIIDVVVYAILVTVAVITLLPFIYMACVSLFPSGEGMFGLDWDKPSFDKYRQLVREPGFCWSIVNSVFLASVTSLVSVVIAAMGGYALSVYTFRGKRFLLGLVMFVWAVPPILLLAPRYQLLFRMGCLDSHVGVVMLALAPAVGVFLFRQSMMNSVPDEIIDMARIDGCGEIRIFFSIVLPLVRPTLATFLLITFLWTWNNFIDPQIVLQSSEAFPLSVAMAQLRSFYGSDYGVVMAGTLVSIAPVVCLFLLVQREYISRVTHVAVQR